MGVKENTSISGSVSFQVGYNRSPWLALNPNLESLNLQTVPPTPKTLHSRGGGGAGEGV